MASDKKQNRHHECPHIPAGWDVKMTGPAYYDGQSSAAARTAWASWLRRLAAHTGRMPRTLR